MEFRPFERNAGRKYEAACEVNEQGGSRAQRLLYFHTGADKMQQGSSFLPTNQQRRQREG